MIRRLLCSRFYALVLGPASHLRGVIASACRIQSCGRAGEKTVRLRAVDSTDCGVPPCRCASASGDSELPFFFPLRRSRFGQVGTARVRPLPRGRRREAEATRARLWYVYEARVRATTYASRWWALREGAMNGGKGASGRTLGSEPLLLNLVGMCGREKCGRGEVTWGFSRARLLAPDSSGVVAEQADGSAGAAGNRSAGGMSPEGRGRRRPDAMMTCGLRGEGNWEFDCLVALRRSGDGFCLPACARRRGYVLRKPFVHGVYAGGSSP